MDLNSVLQDMKQQNMNIPLHLRDWNKDFVEQLSQKNNQQYECNLVTRNLQNTQKELNIINQSYQHGVFTIIQKNTKLSIAAKQNLFGDLLDNEQYIPIVELLQLKVFTQDVPQQFCLKDRNFKDKIHIRIKQGSIYNVSLKFKVHNNIVSGLRAVNNVQRLMIKVQQQQCIGTFAPKKKQQLIVLQQKLAPEGFFVRGDYKGKLIIVDNQGNVHCQLSYKLTISKDWK